MRDLIATGEGTRGGAFAPFDWGLLTVTAAAWGSAYYFIEIALRGLDPVAIAFVRVLLAAMFLSLVPAARAKRFEPGDRGRIILLGILWLALPLTLYPLAQQWVTSAEAGMVTGAMPVFAAAIAAILLRRVPRSRQTIGLLFGFAGISAIAVASVRGGEANAPFGTVLLVGAVLCYALSVNVAVPLQQRYGSLPVIRRALVVATAGLVIPGSVALAESSFDSWSLGAMAPLGIVCTGVGYVTFSTLAGRVGATRAAATIYLLPPVAIFLGVVFLHEGVRPAALAGTAAVVVGAWFTSRAERRGDEVSAAPERG